MSFDTKNSVALNADGPNVIPLTIGTGTNRALFVAISAPAATDLITGVTWNGIPMTRQFAYVPGYANSCLWVYKLMNPTSGLHDVVISSSPLATGWAYAIAFSDIDQTTPVYTDNSDLGDNFPSNPKNIVITTPTGGYALDIMGVRSSAYSNPTIQNAATAIGTTSNWWGCAAGGYKLNATQLGWSLAGSGSLQYSQYVFSLNPAGGTTVPDAPSGVTATVTSATSAAITGTVGGDGGSPLTHDKFRSTSTPGSIVCYSDTLPVPSTGLTTGVAYTHTLAEHNVNGWSAESSASNSVTPTAVTSRRGHNSDMGGF